MIIYQSDKEGFLEDCFKRDIEDVVLRSYRNRTGKEVGRGELRSWAASLTYMARVLNDDAIPSTCGVAIEYGIPQTAKRVDFLISGVTADQAHGMVLVELKQWDEAQATNKDAVVVTRYNRGLSETSHPSYQAWSYVRLLEGFNEAVYEGGIDIRPCAYLHNYATPGAPLNDEFYNRHTDRAPLFLKGEDERERLRRFITQHLRTGDGGEALYHLERGRIRPSKSLADAVDGMIRGRDEFVLVDDQKVVYEHALDSARAAQDGPKRVVIVEGGPGTGKSVVAVNLLVAATSARLTAKYVTKNAAPRAVFESKLTQTMKKTEYSHLFTGSGSFTKADPETFDVLVVDEAHRLNEKSGLYGNLGENQIKELIEASRCSIFFVDDAQQVTLKDIGTKASIRAWAEKLGAVVSATELTSQFRCNGSDGYLAWLDNVLGIRQTANEKLDGDAFDFRVVDSPDELRSLIVQKNREANRARLVAGYCWPWASKKDPKAYDITFPDFDFQARWNLTKDGGLWIVSPDSLDEVGCIHTCQGLELDYVGVIIGPDLVVRDGQVVADPKARASADRTVFGWKKMVKDHPDSIERVDAIIKNTYRTLMTRGMKGCFVYCTDQQLAKQLRSRMETSIGPSSPS